MAIIYRDDEHTREEHCLRGKLQVVQRVIARGEKCARDLGGFRHGAFLHPKSVTKIRADRGIEGKPENIDRWFSEAADEVAAEFKVAQEKAAQEKREKAKLAAQKSLAGLSALQAESSAALKPAK